MSSVGKNDSEEEYVKPLVPDEPVLRASGLVKQFGPVRALGGVDFVIRSGETVGLVGDNGAGKSTLVKCLAGVYQPDEGAIHIDGSPVRMSSPMSARTHGIETVFQDLALAPDLSVSANIFLGREIRLPGLLGRLGFYDEKVMRNRSRELVSQMGITTLSSVDELTENLSGGQRQALAIARARTWASKVLVLDEPTAALGVRQRGIVMDVIRESSRSGMAVVVVAHDMPALFEVCDRLVVLRHGRLAADFSVAETQQEEVVAAMLGVAS